MQACIFMCRLLYVCECLSLFLGFNFLPVLAQSYYGLLTESSHYHSPPAVNHSMLQPGRHWSRPFSSV